MRASSRRVKQRRPRGADVGSDNGSRLCRRLQFPEPCSRQGGCPPGRFRL